MELTGPLLSPSLKKKPTPKKDSYISGNGTFQSSKKNFFYTPNETPLEETGCLCNLFTDCSYIQFLNSPLFPRHIHSAHFYYPTTHCAVLV